MENRIKIGSVITKYIDEGQGKTILFIHGWLVPKEGFIPLIEKLKKNFRCIAIDLPGFGSQTNKIYGTEEIRRFILSFISKLKLEKPHIFGSSMGGYLTVEIASRDPEIFDKIILRSPLLNKRQLPFFFGNTVFSKIHHFLTGYNKIRNYYFTLLKSAVLHSIKTTTDPVKNIIEKCFQNSDTYSLRKLFFESIHADETEKIGRISNPILYIYNSKDKLTKWKPIKKRLENFKNIVFSESANNLHMIFNDEFDKETILIREFLLPARSNLKKSSR